MKSTSTAAWVVLFLLVVAPSAVYFTNIAQGAPFPATATPDTEANSESSGNAKGEPAPADKAEERSDVEALRNTKRQVEKLIAGTLEPIIDPLTLFDIDIHDDLAIRVDAERLRAVIRLAEPETANGKAPAGGKKLHSGKTTTKRPGAASDRKTDDNQEPAAEEPLDTVLFRVRLDLDRARLAFYTLPQEHRVALLNDHAERQRIEREMQQNSPVMVAEQKANEVETARLKALEEAQRAPSEAERTLAEEKVKILEFSHTYAKMETGLARRTLALQQHTEQTLAFHKRVRETLAQDASDAGSADRLYDELRIFLRASREEFSQAISEISAESEIPILETGISGGFAQPLDDREGKKAAEDLATTRTHLREREASYRRTHAAQLYDEVQALNGDRLALLERLSDTKRNDITGFSPAGLDQAVSEFTQIRLVLDYRFTTARHWIRGWGEAQEQGSAALFDVSFTAFKWGLLIFAFWVWRRRSGPLLERWIEKLREEQRRMQEPEPSGLYRVLIVMRKNRSPLEWLVLGWLLVALLPAPIQDHLEVHLATALLSWILAGTFAVGIIDTLAGFQTVLYRPRASAQPTDEIRLRSLRLAGRTVVAFGLILTLSARLVGQGTIYSWFFSVCWFASVPVVLIIVRLWSGTIFTRMAALRKKGPFTLWVLTHRTGWQSFAAAVTAGAYLFVNGSWRVIRSWVTSFDIARRGHAYLFRHGMERLAEQKKESLTFRPLEESLFLALGPETVSRERLPSLEDAKVDEITACVTRVGGGLFAVVGERGSGKTTIAHHVSAQNKGLRLVDCPPGGLDGLRQVLASTLGLGPECTITDCATLVDVAGEDSGVLIDHAHRLIRPCMGGLAEFDQLVKIARKHSEHGAWFFVFNERIWRFIESARGARPLFDNVVRIASWREEEIAQLILARCAQAEILPTFEHLISKLPVDADDIDRAEAAQRVASGYYRMIWDYSEGNPGIALHTWRQSLGIDPEGLIAVKPFQIPDMRELERLPEYVAFIFRAVIQLEPAQAEDIKIATMLRRPQVENMLRYGVMHGYFVEREGRYWVTWSWYRTVTKFLRHRHLLTNL